MAGTCITCLSTQNLIDMEENEWKVFDILLHPISKQYSGIKTNQLAKLCTSCQYSMQYVERFRESSLKNFMLLMNVWNTCKCSSIATDDNPVNPAAVVIKKEFMLEILPTFSETIVSQNIKKEKEEVQSDKEEEAAIFPDAAVKIEINNDLDSEDNVEGKRIEEQRQITPIFSGGYLVPVETVQNKGNNVIFPSCTENPDETESTNMVPSSALLKPNQPSKEKPNDIKREQSSPVNCDVCNKTFKNKCALKGHKKYAHKERVYCDVCDKYYARSSMRGHFKKSPKHNTPEVLKASRVSCEICNSTYRDKHVLSLHMKIHTDAKYCEPCDKWFSPSSYRKHLAQSLKHISKEDYITSRVSCEICNSTYRDKYVLNLHMKIHTDAKYCEPCDKWFSPSSYRKHLAQSLKHISKEDYKFSCDHCNKKFLTKTVLRNHITVLHLKRKPFKCPHCALQFKYVSARARHVRLAHERLAHERLAHERLAHERLAHERLAHERLAHERLAHERRPYQTNHVCNLCGKAWLTSQMLRDHMSVHTGERRSGTLFTHKKLTHERQKCAAKKKKTS